MSDAVMLQGLLDGAAAEYPSGLSKDEFSEFFCADKLLTNYDVTYEEIAEGIVDGSGDGGIDAGYLFVDPRLVKSDFNFAAAGDNPSIELVVIQSKNVDGFSEVPVDKLTSVFNAFLLSEPTPTTLAAFSQEIANLFAAFKNARAKLAVKFPQVTVSAFYCCRGLNASTSIKGKAAALAQALDKPYPFSKVGVLGVSELYSLAKDQKTLTKLLPTVVPPLNVPKALVGLVRLADFANFITDDQGVLINRIFESNVRDYQGEIEVNREIAGSLQPGVATEFWWLNNGVTIVADKAQYDPPNITIRNPLIVNGLQTSFEIHAHAAALSNDSRNILVRIIEESDQKEREKIIRATNRQTAIKHSSFRASDEIHVKIEDFLKVKGYYYDRRKNSYKRQGKPADRIIGIDRLGQAVLAVLLQEPQTARARPGTALKDDVQYAEIFADDAEHPLEMYAVLTILLMQVEAYFRVIRKNTERDYVNNMKFHMLMVLAWTLNKNSTLPGKRIAQLDPTFVTDNMLAKVSSWVFDQFDQAGRSEQVARDGEFTCTLRSAWTVAATS